jgi:predicted Rossmann fold flavoprotein
LHDVNYQFSVVVNWLPGMSEIGVRETLRSHRETSAAQKVMSRSQFGLPHRLWEFLALTAGCGKDVRWADLPAAVQNRLINNLVAQEFAVSGKTTYKEEFVTAGGVSLKEINSNTMESKLWKGLYFAGEIMNVDGITGGYNFQHAWTSGYIAASAIADAASVGQHIK